MNQGCGQTIQKNRFGPFCPSSATWTVLGFSTKSIILDVICIVGIAMDGSYRRAAVELMPLTDMFFMSARASTNADLNVDVDV